MSAVVCPNCQAFLATKYCGACGQAAAAAHPPTLAHLARELTHELLHVDGKIWRTIAALFVSPGKLTEEYWRGRRASWIGPFRVFLIAAAANLVLVSGIGPMSFQTSLQRQPNGEFDVFVQGGSARSLDLSRGAVVEGVEFENYVYKLRTAYASVRYLAIPAFAAVALLLYRKREAYYASHLVMAVHFYSFWYLTSLVTSRIPGVGAAVGIGASAAYLLLTLRRLFHEHVIATLAKGVVLYAVMLVLELGIAFTAASWVSRSLS